ncbi:MULTISPECIES: hypothetical protein [unclassified Duganella]|uniref:hypothetical protein n=1 Tax=unclassified Duganella TaxID=2636909 RepID=UPI000E352015|nr:MULTISPECIES: hypothetical protein [unclassified Duganella]RFP19292.1 hypothetical protein D0T23_05805 [Duganella sp. BJB475]RFP35873.1 hypothetical protein D0T21_05350 [Duganella sp. BJB476]
MPSIRQLHRYLGVFFTPAIVFFAFSGALQTFDLHKGAHRGDPPTYPWIAAMASLHQDQELYQAPAPKPQASKPANPKPEPAAAEPEEHSSMPLKLFVVALAIGLCASSLAGLYIAFSNPRVRLPVGLALAAGMLLPAILLLV